MTEQQETKPYEVVNATTLRVGDKEHHFVPRIRNPYIIAKQTGLSQDEARGARGELDAWEEGAADEKLRVAVVEVVHRNGLAEVIWDYYDEDGGRAYDNQESYIAPSEDLTQWFEKSGFLWSPELQAKVRLAVDPPEGRIDVSNDETKPGLKNVEESPSVVTGLLPEGSTVPVVAEEGYGKSWLVEQIGRQALRGEPVLGIFPPGTNPPQKVLALHFEMSEQDVDIQATDFINRGLETPDGTYIAQVCTGGLNLATDDFDQQRAEDHIILERPDLLIIDAGSNAMPHPQEDGEVRPFFNWLTRMMTKYRIRAVLIVYHYRKQGQENRGKSRAFDDLFGSREWKGRSQKVILLDRTTFIARKDRGGHVGRVLSGRVGNAPAARLRRSGDEDPTAVPFVLEQLPTEEERRAELEDQIVTFLWVHPDEFTKTDLKEEIPGRNEEIFAATKRLLKATKIGPDTRGAKLSVVSESPQVPKSP